MTTVLVVDAANVVGSRPDGWWRDRPGAAQRLHGRLMTADLEADRVILVLEGAAKAGHPVGVDGHVGTVHAAGSGDERILEEVAAAGEPGARVILVTADRVLRTRAEQLGALVMSPSWLLDQLT